MEKVKLPNHQILIDYSFDNYDIYFDEVNNSKRVFVITDQTVFNLYHSEFIKKTKREVFWHILVPGDQSKNTKSLLDITHFLLEKDFKRQDLIVSFGGGMITDIASMAASIFFRGVNLIHIPTSLISQVDSSIGGKTGVNFESYKNVLGTFYDPNLVLIETDYLKSLPEREIVNGLGELIKAGFIGDEKILKALEKNRNEYLSPKLIQRAIEVKKEYVVEDYYDKGVRHVLNLGHTFGHAIESASNFAISHGQAVITGMVKALEIGVMIKVTKPKVLQRLQKIVSYIGLEIPNIPYLEYRKFLLKDKKSFDEGINLTLLEDIGEPAMIQLSWTKLDELASKED